MLEIAFPAACVRFSGGESGADVFDRVSAFVAQLGEDFGKKPYTENCLIVAHGICIRYEEVNNRGPVWACRRAACAAGLRREKHVKWAGGVAVARGSP